MLPALPMRQWVLSVPFPLRFLFANRAGVSELTIDGYIAVHGRQIAATHTVKYSAD